jgi:hypothetical protein
MVKQTVHIYNQRSLNFFTKKRKSSYERLFFCSSTLEIEYFQGFQWMLLCYEKRITQTPTFICFSYLQVLITQLAD